MKKILVGTIMLFFSASTALGYIYQLHVLKKHDIQTGLNQIVIACGDYHDKTHARTLSQKNHLQALVNRIKKPCMLLVEDLSSANTENRLGYGPYRINSCDGLLGEFAKGIRNGQVTVKNVEYRYCRVVSLGPLMNENKMVQRHGPVAHLTVGDLYDELVNEIEVVKKYTDCRILNNFYKKTIQDVHRKATELKLSSYKNCGVEQFCKKFSTEENNKEFLNRLCVFDTQVLDAKMLHEIYRSNQEYVVIISGGTHTKNIAQVLRTMGYTLEYEKTGVNTNALSTSLLTNTVTNHQNPNVIDLQVLEKFLH